MCKYKYKYKLTPRRLKALTPLNLRDYAFSPLCRFPGTLLLLASSTVATQHTSPFLTVFAVKHVHMPATLSLAKLLFIKACF